MQARASVRLAELGSTEAVWLVATMLDHLVKGEVMQVTATPYSVSTTSQSNTSNTIRVCFI